MRLNRPVVGMAASPSGGGYWLVAADGGVFAFGDARFHGSAVAADRYRRFVGMAATPSGDGYWLVTSTECAFTGGTGDVRVRPDSHIVQQTALRTGAHECYDRLVFDFQAEVGSPDAALSYEVGYRTPPFAGPSGLPVAVEGASFLQVVFHGARTYDGNTGEPVYTGPRELQPGMSGVAPLARVEEVQLVEDFEATLAWVVGLDRTRAFNVFQLDGPDRLVIDIGPPVPGAQPAGTTVQVYFTPDPASGDRCDAVVPVPRSVPAATPLTSAVLELLEGPSAVDATQVLTSHFSPEATATRLNGIAVRGGTAFVDFVDFSREIPNASTSCGSAMLLAQLDATVTQFPGVDRAVYSFGGDVGAFYRWLQLAPPG
jgi:hypothetical protein